MQEQTIQCSECKRNIPRAKGISIQRTIWSEKEGDLIKNVKVCFNCYRNSKLKEIRTGRILIIIFIIAGIITYLIRFDLIFYAENGLYELGALPTSEEPYIFATLVFFGLAVLFFLIQRRLLQRLYRMRILYID